MNGGEIMSEHIDLTGQKFGSLTVIEKCGTDKTHKNAMWLCRCDCGGKTKTTTSHLKSGHTQSCGCLKLERFVNGGIKTRFKPKHNLCKTRLYRIWAGMKSRCYNPKNHKYYLYGARGINICSEWLHDFKSFYDWALLNGYKDDLTIDRINNDKGYYPNNCRWATIAEQNRNRRCCKKSSTREVFLNGGKS